MVDGTQLARRTRVSGRRARADAVLVRAAGRGDAEALDELVTRHWPRAHRTAWLIVHDPQAAEDIAQEALLAAVRNLDRFDSRRPFGPWLHRIVANRAIDHARARSRRAELALGALAEPAALDTTAIADDLLGAIAALDPEQRAVIVLRHLLEYTPGEIAALLDLPRGTVNSRLRRGLDHLAGALAEDPS